jgi:hypothetical protein
MVWYEIKKDKESGFFLPLGFNKWGGNTKKKIKVENHKIIRATYTLTKIDHSYEKSSQWRNWIRIIRITAVHRVRDHSLFCGLSTSLQRRPTC